MKNCANLGFVVVLCVCVEGMQRRAKQVHKMLVCCVPGHSSVATTTGQVAVVALAQSCVHFFIPTVHPNCVGFAMHTPCTHAYPATCRVTCREPRAVHPSCSQTGGHTWQAKQQVGARTTTRADFSDHQAVLSTAPRVHQHNTTPARCCTWERQWERRWLKLLTPRTQDGT